MTSSFTDNISCYISMLSLSDCSTEHVSEMNGQFMRVDENYHSYAQDSTKITIFLILIPCVFIHNKLDKILSGILRVVGCHSRAKPSSKTILVLCQLHIGTQSHKIRIRIQKLSYNKLNMKALPTEQDHSVLPSMY